jgi:hypothetical protein
MDESTAYDGAFGKLCRLVKRFFVIDSKPITWGYLGSFQIRLKYASWSLPIQIANQ